MNDNNTISAIVLAAGVATAGGLIYCNPTDCGAKLAKFDSSLRKVDWQNDKNSNRKANQELPRWFGNAPWLKD